MNRILALTLLLSSRLISGPVYDVSVDLTALPAGDYYFDMQFNSGDGTFSNNSATITGFTVLGLTLGSVVYDGTTAGSLLTVLTITDANNLINGALQAFNKAAGAASAQFSVQVTENGTGLPAPDLFTLAILDSGLAPIVPTGIGASLELQSTPGATPVTTPSGGAFAGVRPVVGPTGVVIPEPSTWLLAGFGAIALMLKRRS